MSCFFCVCSCFLISCKSIGNLCRISWRSHSLKKWVQMMMISPVYILCISGNTAILRKVVRQSARGNPKRYCGLFWVHYSSEKERNLKQWHEAIAVCLRVLKESNKSRFDSYSVRNSVLIISHITFQDCRVQIFFRQPFSKYLYTKNMPSLGELCVFKSSALGRHERDLPLKTNWAVWMNNSEVSL